MTMLGEGAREGMKEDAQTNASVGNRCNHLSQSANDEFHREKRGAEKE